MQWGSADPRLRSESASQWYQGLDRRARRSGASPRLAPRLHRRRDLALPSAVAGLPGGFQGLRPPRNPVAFGSRGECRIILPGTERVKGASHAGAFGPHPANRSGHPHGKQPYPVRAGPSVSGSGSHPPASIRPVSQPCSDLRRTAPGVPVDGSSELGRSEPEPKEVSTCSTHSCWQVRQ